MIKIYQKAIKEPHLKTIDEFRAGSWIYVEDPTSEEIEKLATEFRLEQDLLHDAIDPNEVPRLEYDNGVLYIFTRATVREDDRITTAPILIAIGNDVVITVLRKPLPFLERFFNGKIEFYTTQKSKLFTQMFAEINAGYLGFLNDINRKLRGMMVRLEEIENKDIVQFVIYEGILNDFLAALIPTNAMLQKILSEKYIKLYEEDHDLTEDVFLGNGELVELSKSTLKTIVNLREAASTIVTNNLNYVIKLLTALTVVLTVPTMIFSFYGMNVPLPYAEHVYAFAGIGVATTIISLLILGFFVKKKWF